MPEHGKENTYARHGCRCDECREANRLAQRRKRARDKPTPEHVHGTKSGYSYYRCRCVECLRAWKAYHVPYMKAYRQRNKERLSVQEKARREQRKAEVLAAEEARRQKLREAG